MNCFNCKKEVSQIRRTKKYCSPKCRVYFARNKDVILVNGVDNIVRVDLSTGEPQKAPVMITEYKEKVFDFCKHNAVKGLCKKGCK